MLGTLRKFSNSIFAKIFLIIVAIPFVLWGMGPVFRSGSQDTIVKIGREKISIQEFINYIDAYTSPEQNVNEVFIDKLFSSFVGDVVMSKEIKNLNIVLSENSLSKLIKNQKDFKKENKFSRIEYEKFLLKNNLNAIFFEKNLAAQEKRKQLLDFIGSGVRPSLYSINMEYDKINQKRNIQYIDLNDIFVKEINISENQINTFYNQNKEKYKDIYKSIKFIKLNTKNLTGSDEFNDLFFKKIDQIDDLINEGKNLDYILQEYNLESISNLKFNQLGEDDNYKKVKNFPIELVKNIFNISETESAFLIEHVDKYFIIELVETESVQRKITDLSVKKDIVLNLEKKAKQKLISNIISKINKNNFKENDFDKLAKDKNVIINKIALHNKNDDKILEKEVVNQVYAFSEKKIIVVADMNLEENFLIFIDKIENVSINKDSEYFDKYLNLSKIRITNNLYNTYDLYLRNKYNIDINYNALNEIKSNLR